MKKKEKAKAKKEVKAKKPTLKEKIEMLKNQQEQTKEVFLKISGAVEMLEAMQIEEAKNEEDK